MDEDDAFVLGTFLAFEGRNLCNLIVTAELAEHYAELEQYFVTKLSDALAPMHLAAPETTAAAIVPVLAQATRIGIISFRGETGKELPVTISDDLAMIRTAGMAMLDTLQRLTDADARGRPPARLISTIQQTILRSTARLPLPDLLTSRSVMLSEAYVEPSLYSVRSREYLTLTRIDWLSGHKVILGNPGGGKSTLLRALAHSLAQPDSRILPARLDLRRFEQEISSGESLPEILAAVLGQLGGEQISGALVQAYLEQGFIFPMLDGLDELSHSATRDLAVQLAVSAGRYPVPLVLTARLQGIDMNSLADHFDVLIVQDLSHKQIAEYVARRFAVDKRDDLSVDQFMKDSEGIADIRRNPLMLALLCILYNGSQHIPETRAALYRQCAYLMFREWDRHRRIEMGAEFDDFLHAALEELAFRLFFGCVGESEPLGNSEELIRGYNEGGAAAADRTAVEAVIASYLAEWHLPSQAQSQLLAHQFVQFCLGRLWILTPAGEETDATSQSLGFVHKTFLEYFTAQRLARSATPEIVTDLLIKGLPDPALSVVLEVVLQLLAEKERGYGDRLMSGLKDWQSIPARALVLRAVPLRPDSLAQLIASWRQLTLAMRARSAVSAGTLLLAAMASARRSNLITLMTTFPTELEREPPTAPQARTLMKMLQASSAELVQLADESLGYADTVRLFEAYTDLAKLASPILQRAAGDAERDGPEFATMLRNSLIDVNTAIERFGPPILFVPFRDTSDSETLASTLTRELFDEEYRSRTSEPRVGEFALALGQWALSDAPVSVPVKEIERLGTTHDALRSAAAKCLASVQPGDSPLDWAVDPSLLVHSDFDPDADAVRVIGLIALFSAIRVLASYYDDMFMYQLLREHDLAEGRYFFEVGLRLERTVFSFDDILAQHLGAPAVDRALGAIEVWVSSWLDLDRSAGPSSAGSRHEDAV